MLETLARNWWALALRGVLAILFGVVAVIWPGPTLLVLVLLFGAYVMADGILALVSAFSRRETAGGRLGLVLEGIVGLAVGVVTFLWPPITAVALLYFIAAWAIATGIFELIAAIRLRKEIEGEFWLGLGGVLSVVLGVALFLLPGPGLLAIIWLVAAYAILFGVLMLGLAFRLRRWHRGERGVEGRHAGAAV